MKVGDNVKVIKENYTNDNFIGLIREVVDILDKDIMNIKVKFRKEDNKEYIVSNLINKKVLHFYMDELEKIK